MNQNKPPSSPTNTRQPTVFSKARNLPAKLLAKVDRDDWNAKVVAKNKAKLAAKAARKAGHEG